MPYNNTCKRSKNFRQIDVPANLHRYDRTNPCKKLVRNVGNDNRLEGNKHTAEKLTHYSKHSAKDGQNRWKGRNTSPNDRQRKPLLESTTLNEIDANTIEPHHHIQQKDKTLHDITTFGEKFPNKLCKTHMLPNGYHTHGANQDENVCNENYMTGMSSNAHNRNMNFNNVSVQTFDTQITNSTPNTHYSQMHMSQNMGQNCVSRLQHPSSHQHTLVQSKFHQNKLHPFHTTYGYAQNNNMTHHHSMNRDTNASLATALFEKNYITGRHHYSHHQNAQKTSMQKSLFHISPKSYLLGNKRNKFSY